MIRLLNTLDDFVAYVKEPYNQGLAREILANQCTEEVRQNVYNLADSGSDDPIKNALEKLGISI